MLSVASSNQTAPLSFGGEMELSPGQARAALSGTEFEFGGNTCAVASGRTGLGLIAEVIAATGGGSVLLPAYLCPSLLQPFREQNLPLAFYGIRDDLSIDTEHLLGRVAQLRPRAVLVIHYFGFPAVGMPESDRDATVPRPWLIEDCVQGSWPGDAGGVVGAIGDFVFTSFRKYLPVPDGGLVLCRVPGVALPRLEPAAGRFIHERVAAKVLRHRFLHRDSGTPHIEQTFLARLRDSEHELDRRVPRCGMSRFSLRLMRQLDLAGAVQRRRGNFQAMLDAFAADARLRRLGTPLFAALPAGVSPLAFPIRVRCRRDRLRRELAARRVFCPVHWVLPENVSPSAFPRAHALAADILSIPIDQRYGPDDMRVLLHRLDEAGDAAV